MARYLLVLLALVSKPWVACQSGLPNPDGSTTTTHAAGQVPAAMQPVPLPTSTTSSTTTLGAAILSTLFLQASGRFMPTDRPPTVPLPNAENHHEAMRKLGSYYRTVYTGANSTTATTTTTTTKNPGPNPRIPSNGNFSDSGTPVSNLDDVVQQLNQSHISRESPVTSSSSRDEGVPLMTSTSSYYYEDVEKVPWHQGHTHHKTHKHHKSQAPEQQQPPPPPVLPEKVPTEKAGPYFRPPSAISHKYKNFRVEEGQDLEDIDPECWPHCRHNSTRGESGSKRKRKHSSNKKRKYYNYKLLYDTLKGDLRRQETEFYAWIFGATMLTLGSLTTLTSCFVFCFCSEKWRKRRQTKRYDKSGQYQRVDSVSSVVDSHHESQDHHEQLDSVTII